MLKVGIGIAIGTAALGLLFYWLRKRKRANYKPNKKEGELAEYGVQVMNNNGNLKNLTDRPIMVMDVLKVPYNSNGTHQFSVPIKGVSIDADYEIDPTSDGKFISVTYSGNTVKWQWESAKALKPTNVKIIVFS